MPCFNYSRLLLYLNPSQYYRYKGSLTAPPCTENVRWIIFKQPIGIRLMQLDEFRKLLMAPKIKTILHKKSGLTSEEIIPVRIGNNYRERQRDNGDYIIYENCLNECQNNTSQANTKQFDSKASAYRKNKAICYSVNILRLFVLTFSAISFGAILSF